MSEWRCGKEYNTGQLRNCCTIETFSRVPKCLNEQNLGQEKGARMHFFKKLFGSVSNSNKKNDYARATLKYASSPEIIKSNAIVCNNRRLAFEANSEYVRPVSHFTRARQINNITVMNVAVTGLQHQRISVTFYRSYTSKTYLSISRS